MSYKYKDYNLNRKFKKNKTEKIKFVVEMEIKIRQRTTKEKIIDVEKMRSKILK